MHAHKQAHFRAEPSATAASAWIGIVEDDRGNVLTRTSMTYSTPSEARFGARLKWIGREGRAAVAARGAAA